MAEQTQAQPGFIENMVGGLRGLEMQLAEAQKEAERVATMVEHQRGAIGMVQQIKDDPDLRAAFLAWLEADE